MGNEVNSLFYDKSTDRKLKQFTEKQRREIDSIWFDGYWNIGLKHHNRVLSERRWEDVKWELKQMVKYNDYEMSF